MATPGRRVRFVAPQQVRPTPGISCERPIRSTLVCFIPLFGSLVPPPQELLRRKPDVLCDLAQQRRRDVSARVEGNSGPTTICMPELLVGTLLPNLREAQGAEKADDLPRV